MFEQCCVGMDGFLLYLRNLGNFLDDDALLLLVKRRNISVVMLSARSFSRTRSSSVAMVLYRIFYCNYIHEFSVVTWALQRQYQLQRGSWESHG